MDNVFHSTKIKGASELDPSRTPLCGGADVNVRQMRFYFQSSEEARETRQAGWPECKLDPVPPGGTTLPDPRGVGPLFPCAPALLEGPLVENEGLWYQHSDYGCALESAPATERGLHLPLPAGSGVRIPPLSLQPCTS